MHKAAAAAIVSAICGVIALVLYSPVHVDAPGAASPSMVTARPLIAVRAAEVPLVAPTREAAPPRAAGDRPASALQPAALPPINAPSPEPLAAVSRAGAMLLPAAVQPDLPRGISSGPRPPAGGALPRAGRALGAAFTTAGRGIGSAFQRAF